MANDNQQRSGNQLGNPQNKSKQGISECLYTQNLNIYPHIIISMQNGPKHLSLAAVLSDQTTTTEPTCFWVLFIHGCGVHFLT